MIYLIFNSVIYLMKQANKLEFIMRLIRMKEVMYLTGLSRPSIYRLMKDGLFPNSIDLGERSVAWVDEEVQDWVEQKINSARSN